jgi:Asp-tRNA(Asn)/Glu-tRNA(Gln) amidotransferase A subunit family amidase
VTVTSLVQAAAAIESGETTSAELVGRYLARIKDFEAETRVFSWFDEGRAIALAREADGRSTRAGLPLRGVPVGVKDIIDIAGLPTSCGTRILEGRTPTESATVVSRLEDAGAIALGKTVTAELAFATPGPTTNPWNALHTPGGSSMGSAAGVAAGFFPAALGTQTNSSTIMPAALCGVIGFKPTAGRVPLSGIMRFSPSLDQVGTFTTTVADAALVASVLTETAVESWLPAHPSPSPRFAVARTSAWSGAAQAIRDRFAGDVSRLASAGAVVDEAALPVEFDDARATHRTIMAFEAARHVTPLVAARTSELSAPLSRFLAEGEAIRESDYRAALSRRQRLADVFETWVAPYDAVLTPAAPDEAPLLPSTGDPRFCTSWTLIGAPAIVLPSGCGPRRLPIGLQLVGGLQSDRKLLAAALFAELLLDAPPLPAMTT